MHFILLVQCHVGKGRKIEAGGATMKLLKIFVQEDNALLEGEYAFGYVINFSSF